MSYLNNLRMVFTGKFQSDVSTINNDVTHYDIENFLPKYQEYGSANGWWNPCGSGAFRLIDCKVTQVGYKDGTTTSDSKSDPVIGMLIGGSNELTSAKMVDLDPQMQMVSEIWGLTMRLTDGKTSGFFEGKFFPAPFRDILFGRQKGASADGAATAIYQSVLQDLSWIDVDSSPFLKQLKAMADKSGKLSVRMMVYSYQGDHTSPEFTLGSVSGVIGPALDNEPNTFVLGRRFAPLNGTSTAKNINFFNAQVDPVNRNLCVDLSNALPLKDGKGNFVDIGKIQLVVLEPAFESTLEANIIHLKFGQFTPISNPVPYLESCWMENAGAIFNIADIDLDLFNKIQNQPLAMIDSESGVVLIRETTEGLLVRVDQVVHRLNPPVSVTVDFYACRYGHPAAGEQIKVTLENPSSDQPVINIPASAIELSPIVSTDGTGKASYSYFATKPDNPRVYIDGQLYFLNYKPVAISNYIQPQLDIIANIVYDALDVPKYPTWNDIKPIMAQYDNLYPIMGRMLINLKSYASIVEYRNILELAFSRDQHDPNYMPVTRDLSEPKRKMILKWLSEQDANGNYVLRKGNTFVDIPPIEPCASCEIDVQPPQKIVKEVSEEVIGSEIDISVTIIEEKVEGSKERAIKQFISNFRNRP